MIGIQIPEVTYNTSKIPKSILCSYDSCTLAQELPTDYLEKL
jgi:hypothetical protein